MPNYNFRNNETGEEFEEFFTISGREEFLKSNPHITQMPSLFSMAGGTGDRIKNDEGWKENLSRIAEAHPRSNLADRYSKKSVKQSKTEQVLKKHIDEIYYDNGINRIVLVRYHSTLVMRKEAVWSIHHCTGAMVKPLLHL